MAPRVSTEPTGRVGGTLLCVQYVPCQNIASQPCHVLSGSLLYGDRSHGRLPRLTAVLRNIRGVPSLLLLLLSLLVRQHHADSLLPPIHPFTHRLCRPSRPIFFFCNYVLFNTAYYTRCTVLPVPCFHGNTTDKVYQRGCAVMDHTCSSGHIQLTQSDCTPRYATARRKINKYGGRCPQRCPTPWSSPQPPPPRFLHCLPLVWQWGPGQIMPPRCPCRHKRQVLCRHHSKLGLFSPNSSNAPFMHSKTPSAPVLPGAITADQGKKRKERKKNEKEKKNDNSCCQTKGKQRGQEKVRH